LQGLNCHSGHRAQGGQFVLHAKAPHGNPYDGHTLGPVIADLEKLTGVTVHRIHGDRGYRGHNYPNRFKVWISGQVRRVTKAIRREMRRRDAIEPVIGHLKEDHRMGRNYLAGRDGDRINAVLAAAGYNFSLFLRWFEELLRVLSFILRHAVLAAPLHLTRGRKTFFTADFEATGKWQLVDHSRTTWQVSIRRAWRALPVDQWAYAVEFPLQGVSPSADKGFKVVSRVFRFFRSCSSIARLSCPLSLIHSLTLPRRSEAAPRATVARSQIWRATVAQVRMACIPRVYGALNDEGCFTEKSGAPALALFS
jgi:hypothetical protein